MTLPHALLGLLNYNPATGYDLKAAFENSINLFWNASLPQIYRTLGQMEKDGWLTFTTEHQAGKPSRKIYHITNKGKKEFQKWLAVPPDFPEPKNAMLVKLFFANQTEKKVAAEHIKKWREHYVKFLETMEKNVRPTAEGYAEKVADNDEFQFWMLAADYGIRNAKMVIEWCEAALKIVEKKKKN